MNAQTVVKEDQKETLVLSDRMITIQTNLVAPHSPYPESEARKKISHPYRSTTHQERFYHVDVREEVIVDGKPELYPIFTPQTGPYPITHRSYFFRKEGDVWSYSFVSCGIHDQYSRKEGRKRARRRYFQGERSIYGTSAPTYEDLPDL